MRGRHAVRGFPVSDVRSVILLSAALAASMAFPLPAGAEDACEAPDTQMAMNQCADAEVVLADGALQAAYDSLRERLGPAERKRLRTAQRAWIAYRDGWCSFQTMGVERGSAHPDVLGSCQVRLIREQTARIVHQLTCSADVDCMGDR
jgi:uncharacterized protein YecT (DUF1311 family)